MTNTAKIVVTFGLLAVLAIGYMVWLDSGCTTIGAMTWHGKICID